MYIIIDPLLLLKHENAELQSQVQHLETTLREMLQKTYSKYGFVCMSRHALYSF